MRADDNKVDVITDPADLVGLRSQWDELYARAETPRLSQSFEWVWCAWQDLAQPQGSRLHCVVVRRNGRLVLVWPMVVSRHKRLWTVATSLGSPEDYADILVEDAPEQQAIVTKAWRALRDHCPVDFVRLEHLRADSLLYQVLAVDGWRQVAVQVSPSLTWDGYPSWDSYWRSRGSTFPKTVDRKHRRLQDIGRTSLEVVQTPERCKQMISWMFRQKEEWLSRKNTSFSVSIGSKPYERFLLRAAESVSTHGRVSGFSLNLDGRMVATQISLVDDCRIENIHIAFDPTYSKYSPGIILDKLVLEWAFDRRLSYDFHFGTDDRKRTLARENCEICTCHRYVTKWGGAYELLRAAKNWRLLSNSIRPRSAMASRPSGTGRWTS